MNWMYDVTPQNYRCLKLGWDKKRGMGDSLSV